MIFDSSGVRGSVHCGGGTGHGERAPLPRPPGEQSATHSDTKVMRVMKGHGFTDVHCKFSF